MKPNKLKDFFHDINDILLALVIVLIAAVVIVWRFNVIMEYPEKVSQMNASVAEEPVDTDESAIDGE